MAYCVALGFEIPAHFSDANRHNHRGHRCGAPGSRALVQVAGTATTRRRSLRMPPAELPRRAALPASCRHGLSVLGLRRGRDGTNSEAAVGCLGLEKGAKRLMPGRERYASAHRNYRVEWTADSASRMGFSGTTGLAWVCGVRPHRIPPVVMSKIVTSTVICRTGTQPATATGSH